MAPSADSDAPRLAGDLAWSRRLAVVLAGGDEALADELVGDAWLLAVQRGRVEDEGWLRGALRRLAGNRRRGEARRTARERAAARPEADGAPGPAELVARAELCQRVGAHVLALDADERDLVLGRHMEGLSIAALATRAGASEGAVKMRLSRARAKLRAAIDRERGGRGAWCALLGLGLDGRPLAHLAAPALTTTAGPLAVGLLQLGGLVMTTKLLAAAAALLVAGLAGVALWGPDEDAVRPKVAAAEEGPAQAQEPATLQAQEPAAPVPARVAPEEPAAAEDAAAQAPSAVAVPEPELPTTGELAGVLAVPPEWGWSQDDGGELEFSIDVFADRRLDTATLERVPGFGTWLAFRLSDVPDGPVDVSFEALGARWAIRAAADSEPGARQALELVVLPPVELRVSVVARRSDGSPDTVEVEGGFLSWVQAIDGSHGFSSRMAQRAQPGLPYVLQVPAGTIAFTYHHEDFEFHRASVAAGPGAPRDVQLVLERALTVTIEFLGRDGEPAVLPFSFDALRPDLVRLDPPMAADEDPLVLSTSLGEGRIRYTLRTPGRYRLRARVPEPTRLPLEPPDESTTPGTPTPRRDEDVLAVHEFEVTPTHSPTVQVTLPRTDD